MKPENIVLTEHPAWPYGLAKLVDFGLTRNSGVENASKKVPAGTPNYMSPEHLCGAAPTPDLDLWALAATAFTALTGTCAFDAEHFPALVDSICKMPPPMPSERLNRIPGGVDCWFELALAHDPSLRFRSPSALAEAFKAACEEVTPESADTEPQRGIRHMTTATLDD